MTVHNCEGERVARLSDGLANGLHVSFGLDLQRFARSEPRMIEDVVAVTSIGPLVFGKPLLIEG